MFTRLAIILCALTASLAAQAALDEPATDTATIKKQIELHVARNGDEILVTWTLPAVPIKGLDIYRNTRDQTPGRSRVDFVRPEPAVFIDKVTDPKTPYWYWLKVVLPDGQFVNIGPVKTPNAVVWTP